MSIIDYSHYPTAPWLKHYDDACKRCNKKYKQCYKTNTNMILSRDEIRALWFRDKAMGMYQASLDRIDTSENYTYDNCRFIEMALNRRLPRRKPITSKSKYKGVLWAKTHKKFRVTVCKDGKEIHIGHYANEKEAARIYNEATSRLFGQTIVINKV